MGEGTQMEGEKKGRNLRIPRIGGGGDGWGKEPGHVQSEKNTKSQAITDDHSCSAIHTNA